jgi:amidase
LGRTNVPELCMSATCEGLTYGPTHNPWNLAHSTGGSSGGSAAAVAAGLVPVAHGNDAGGSIRIPASACGLVGLKPSRGRTSFGPDHEGDWAGFNHEHVLTRSVRDSAAVLDAIALSGPALPWIAEVGADPGCLRVGFLSRSGGMEATPDVVSGVAATAALLDSLGHHVDAAILPDLDGYGQHAMLLGAVCARHVARWGSVLGRPLGEDDLEPMTWLTASGGGAMSATAFLAAQEAAQQWAARVRAWWDHHDVLLTPTMAIAPPPLGQLSPTTELGALILGQAQLTAFTMPFNITGQPAISLPLHTSSDGLPVGMQLVAGVGREDVLLRLAGQLEQALPWVTRHPEVHP